MQKGQQTLCLVSKNQPWMLPTPISRAVSGIQLPQSQDVFFTLTAFSPSSAPAPSGLLLPRALNCLLFSSLQPGFIAKYNHGIEGTGLRNFSSCHAQFQFSEHRGLATAQLSQKSLLVSLSPFTAKPTKISSCIHMQDRKIHILIHHSTMN